MNFQFSIINFQKRGFTLVETMVAVTILTFAVAGPLFTASRAIVAAQNARDQLTASYLAQEGIEYVRMLRDNEFLALYPGDTSAAWTNFLSVVAPCNTSAGATKGCTFEPIVNALTACTIGSTCTALYLANGLYTQSNAEGVQTAFTRTIQTADFFSSGKREKITSKVSWSFHGTSYSVTLYDALTPWQ